MNRSGANITPGVLKLIEKHIAMQNLKGWLADAKLQPGQCIVDEVAYGPCLLVSREYGCGGGVIARRAGERLGWTVFDRELVKEIAEIGHVRQRLVESVDERVRTYWERTWQEMMKEEEMGDERYLRYLRQVVMSLGHHGKVVMVGRGAQHLLPRACGLRVRVVAPLEFRVKEVAQREGLPPDQAWRRLHEFDAARRDFIRKVFKCHADSPLNYDLVINTGEISIDGATEVVLTALREKLGVQAGRVVSANLCLQPLPLKIFIRRQP